MHRTQEQSDAKVNDDDRCRHLFRMACKIKELDELKEIRSAHQRFTKVQKQYDLQDLSTASSGISIPAANGRDHVPYFEALNQINTG
jgi:hypothetical protein